MGNKNVSNVTNLSGICWLFKG